MILFFYLVGGFKLTLTEWFYPGMMTMGFELYPSVLGWTKGNWFWDLFWVWLPEESYGIYLPGRPLIFLVYLLFTYFIMVNIFM